MILKIKKIEKDNEGCSLYPQIKMAFGATNLEKIFTYVDASYAVHHGMKIQNGSAMSTVLGITHCRSIKNFFNK